jgi:hypothetical protein
MIVAKHSAESLTPLNRAMEWEPDDVDPVADQIAQVSELQCSPRKDLHRLHGDTLGEYPPLSR